MPTIPHTDPAKPIVVFGSNKQGIHGSGQALDAKRRYGAVQHIGRGLCGNSYAIPTKKTPYQRMELFEIADEVEWFLSFARLHHNFRFIVWRLGCGRAGYNDNQIAPLFKDAPTNCTLPEIWVEIIKSKRRSE